MESVPGDYIAGFVDGEGCFALKFRRDVRHERKNKPVYFSWDIEFAILLKSDDAGILESIKHTLECGKISLSKAGAARYAVNNIHDLMTKVVPFFERYTLRAKKRHDFKLWKEAVEIFKKNQRSGINSSSKGFKRTVWDAEDIRRLQEIKTEMERYKGGNRHNWKWLANT